ncbi:MAG: VOC family protein [Chloroflexota bacterium]|nr:VOC family protein [Chloroflexota bacterium]
MAGFQKITPFLWYDGQALEAARHYVSLFPDSRIDSSDPLPAGPAEGAAIVSFVLAGQQFTALDGGPMYQFSPAISFVVSCESQAEIDHFYDGLAEGGAREQCGWVRDRYGVTWQIVPVQLGELLEAGADRVMATLLEMEKIDLATLESAARGE